MLNEKGNLMRKLILVLLLFSKLGFAATTKDIAPDFGKIVGTGGLSCGKFVEAKDMNNQMQLDLYVQWVWGFLSAYEHHGSFDKDFRRIKHLNDLPDSPTVILSLDSYCHKNPTSHVVNGALNLLYELGAPIVWKPAQ